MTLHATQAHTAVTEILVLLYRQLGKVCALTR